MNQAVRQMFALDSALSRLFSEVEERPYGLLFYNEANPNHHAANRAREIRADDPAAAIEDIITFYRARRLKPRVSVNDLTRPADLAARLQSRGFTVEPSATRVMQSQPRLKPYTPQAPITIRRAVETDRAAIMRIDEDATAGSDNAWLDRKLQYLLPHPAVRYYLASFDGEPAGAACVFESGGWALIEDVATFPAFRGRGLATALIASIQAETTTPLLLEVAAENAARIYRRADFEDRGELRETTCWLPDEAGATSRS